VTIEEKRDRSFTSRDADAGGTQENRARRGCTLILVADSAKVEKCDRSAAAAASTSIIHRDY
jgi:hypothetical protein